MFSAQPSPERASRTGILGRGGPTSLQPSGSTYDVSEFLLLRALANVELHSPWKSMNLHHL